MKAKNAVERIERKIIHRFLGLLIVYSLGMSFEMATYVMFLLSHDLNLFEVNLVNGIFMVSCALMEFPTGIIADVFGRKTSFIFSCFFSSLGMFVYYYSSSFWWFVLAEVIISVGRACFSGAFDSWVIDSLKFHGCSDESEEKWWRSSKIMRRLCFLGAFAGSFFAGKFGLAFPWLIGGIISFLAGIIALFFSESYRKASDFILTSKTRNLCSLWKILKLNFKKETSLFFSVTKKSWLFFWNNPIGKFLSILVFVNLFSFQGPNMQWAPFFAEKISQNPFVWGFIWSGISLCVILGTLLSKFVGKLFNGDKKTSLLSIQLFIGFFLALSSLGFFSCYAIFIFFLFHEIGRGIFEPVSDHWLNQNIPSAERASLNSLNSLFGHLGAGCGLLMSGFLGNYFSINLSWFFSASVLITSSFFFRDILLPGSM